MIETLKEAIKSMLEEVKDNQITEDKCADIIIEIMIKFIINCQKD